jgi:tetratricopeptide (TPR) repeat protein
MKRHSLRSLIVLLVLILIQTGCNPQSNTNEGQEKNKEVLTLKKRAEFLRHEGDIDSAISYYRKSLALCYIIEKESTPNKDTTATKRIAQLNNNIGYVYDSLHNFDSATKYLVESIKWARLSNIPNLIISDEWLIGFIYYNAGNKCTQGSSERKKFYSTGVIYMRTAIRNLDSLCLPQKKITQDEIRLSAYAANKIMYKELGDSDNTKFYRNKYMELQAQLNSRNQ